ncbi:RNA polymerase sigma factor [Kribbella solani]|uniref:RNA polymerase sigma-70 factor (ECF subfamily) n=1 Tax=Kribbella solani TaxID=236067 RepID=A0A841DTM9_9ACTN|nr:sigma-70 family RNA polymerase sigma factor [Kribbella solani]MBB5980245.1 RNA polymerase sigma-70 factor (ECF subfamily) [Kribbella solani]
MTLIQTTPGLGSGEAARVVGGPPDPGPNGFDTLFRCHHDDVLRYFVRRLDIRADAADLVAETFLVAWRRMDAVPGKQPLPWLYGVARRVLANHRRGEVRRHGLADRLRDDLRTVPAEAEIALELRHASEVFRQLSDADRELLSLVAWEGLDTTQLAAAIGCTRSTAAVRLHRARRRLDRLMSHPYQPDGNRSVSGEQPAPARGETR